MDYTLEEQTVTICEDLEILHYILAEFEEYDNYRHTHEQDNDIRHRIQTLCYRLEKDLKDIKNNIGKVIEKGR